MPIYEYRCAVCRRRSSLFFQTFSAAETATPQCEHCGSLDVARLVSRVAILKSEESRLDDLADDSSLADVDESDPRSVARWARRMGEQLGDEAGDEFREMVDQLEAGEMPDDLAGGHGEDDDFGGMDANESSDPASFSD
ncbi:MAG: zinc ribbon domain-containing protein [Chloroflexi bacterium]|nr:zinc ribbon domain-containing protein [Chloroflexota bacterium]